jgi:peptide/nickel transport system substrate-binding protein
VKRALLAALLLAATLAAGQDAPRELIYGAGLTPRGFNPLLDAHEWNEVSSVVYSRLFRPDHAGKIVGDLVESYEVSPDGLTWTLKLRQNAQWHDGKPFTSDDVLFTWETLFDANTASSLDLNQPMVRSFEAQGTHGFVFHLKYADAGFLAPLTEIAILPAHRLRGKDVSMIPHPVGTGPYKLVRRAGRDYVFEAHAAYPFGAPAIPRLTLRVIPNDDARAEAVAKGEVHLAQVKAQHVEKLRATSGVRVYRMKTGAWRAMPLNLRRPALKDARVRRAIDLAIDREKIVAAALPGAGQPAYGPIPPASWAFAAEMNARRYGPAAAARLLDQAGWAKNKDGRRERDGVPLALDIIVWKDELFRRSAAEMVRDQLGTLGVTVNLHLVDNVEYNRLAGAMGDKYDTFIGGWGGLLDPGDNLAKKYRTGGSQNYGGYSNPEVDRLLDRVRALGPEQRGAARDIYKKIVALVTTDAVFLPVAYPEYVFAASVNVGGIDELICDSWYEFTKYAHEWRWKD